MLPIFCSMIYDSFHMEKINSGIKFLLLSFYFIIHSISIDLERICTKPQSIENDFFLCCCRISAQVHAFKHFSHASNFAIASLTADERF